MKGEEERGKRGVEKEGEVAEGKGKNKNRKKFKKPNGGLLRGENEKKGRGME
jgi:hypothetical protein